MNAPESGEIPAERHTGLEPQIPEFAARIIAELQSRDALKTQFLANISHDLRTPLTAIITHAEILRDGILGELTPRQREVLSFIAEGRRMKEIAAILQLSTRTVETHKYEMMRSLGVESTVELVRYALHIGMITR